MYDEYCYAGKKIFASRTTKLGLEEVNYGTNIEKILETKNNIKVWNNMLHNVEYELVTLNTDKFSSFINVFKKQDLLELKDYITQKILEQEIRLLVLIDSDNPVSTSVGNNVITYSIDYKSCVDSIERNVYIIRFFIENKSDLLKCYGDPAFDDLINEFNANERKIIKLNLLKYLLADKFSDNKIMELYNDCFDVDMNEKINNKLNEINCKTLVK